MAKKQSPKSGSNFRVAENKSFMHKDIHFITTFSFPPHPQNLKQSRKCVRFQLTHMNVSRRTNNREQVLNHCLTPSKG